MHSQSHWRETVKIYMLPDRAWHRDKRDENVLWGSVSVSLCHPSGKGWDIHQSLKSVVTVLGTDSVVPPAPGIPPGVSYSAQSPWSFSPPSALKSSCLFGNWCPKHNKFFHPGLLQGRDLFGEFRAPKILDCQSRPETVPAALKNLLMSVVPILCRRKSIWDWNRWTWSQLQAVYKRHLCHTSLQLPRPAQESEENTQDKRGQNEQVCQRECSLSSPKAACFCQGKGRSCCLNRSWETGACRAWGISARGSREQTQRESRAQPRSSPVVTEIPSYRVQITWVHSGLEAGVSWTLPFCAWNFTPPFALCYLSQDAHLHWHVPLGLTAATSMRKKMV